MNADEARELHAMLRRLGVPGVVAPEDPENLEGSWYVYDVAATEVRREVTADTLAALAAARQRPGRGFVIPRTS
ncbi:hypothetical protein [Streptomyces subrutilus]|uniref:hypothetical protein n=1 Tax=Streptomyces subrutilus TaxID=36818 RepID=UPI0033F8C80C